jgi:hypothetical protein
MEIGPRIARPEGLSIAETHSHTTASDGMETAVDLVRAAAAIGVSVICVTDHDTVSPLGEAIEVGAELGVDVEKAGARPQGFPSGPSVQSRMPIAATPPLRTAGEIAGRQWDGLVAVMTSR